MSQSLKTILCLSAVLCLPASAALAGGPAYVPQAPELLPSSSNAGECYARVKIPAQYSEQPVGVKVEEGYEVVDVTQPQLASRQESVLVKEASVRYEVRQPTYRTQTEQILVRPAYEKLRVSEPQFKTVTEHVQTSAPRLVWKQGNPADLKRQGYKIHSTADGGRFGQGYGTTSQYASQGGTKCGPTCEIWCLVEEPAEMASYTRKVLVEQGMVQRETVPAKYKSIVKSVVADPGGVREIPVPAEYKTVVVEDLVAPAQEIRRYVEPKYAGLSTKTLISPERYEWRRVVCAPGTGSIKSSSAYGHQSSYQGSTTTQTYSGYPTGYGSTQTRSSGTLAPYSQEQYRQGHGAYNNHQRRRPHRMRD